MKKKDLLALMLIQTSIILISIFSFVLLKNCIVDNVKEENKVSIVSLSYEENNNDVIKLSNTKEYKVRYCKGLYDFIDFWNYSYQLYSKGANCEIFADFDSNDIFDFTNELYLWANGLEYKEYGHVTIQYIDIANECSVRFSRYADDGYINIDVIGQNDLLYFTANLMEPDSDIAFNAVLNDQFIPQGILTVNERCDYYNSNYDTATLEIDRFFSHLGIRYVLDSNSTVDESSPIISLKMDRDMEDGSLYPPCIPIGLSEGIINIKERILDCLIISDNVDSFEQLTIKIIEDYYSENQHEVTTINTKDYKSFLSNGRKHLGFLVVVSDFAGNTTTLMTDDYYNSEYANLDIFIYDDIKPEISGPNEINMYVNNNYTYKDFLSKYTARDNIDGVLNPRLYIMDENNNNINTNQTNVFKIPGNYRFFIEATDSERNSTEIIVLVHIVSNDNNNNNNNNQDVDNPSSGNNNNNNNNNQNVDNPSSGNDNDNNNNNQNVDNSSSDNWFISFFKKLWNLFLNFWNKLFAEETTTKDVETIEDNTIIQSEPIIDADAIIPDENDTPILIR